MATFLVSLGVCSRSLSAIQCAQCAHILVATLIVEYVIQTLLHLLQHSDFNSSLFAHYSVRTFAARLWIICGDRFEMRLFCRFSSSPRCCRRHFLVYINRNARRSERIRTRVSEFAYRTFNVQWLNSVAGFRRNFFPFGPFIFHLDFIRLVNLTAKCVFSVTPLLSTLCVRCECVRTMSRARAT